MIPSLTRYGTPRKLKSAAAGREYAAARIPFNAGSVTGTDHPYSAGRLPRDWERVFYADRDRIDYAIYSYATPLAWHTPDGWTVPNVRYSITTSTKHMPLAWAAVGPRSASEPVRTRIDAVTVTAVDWLKSSVNGNPRAIVTLSDGTRAQTSSDASVSYGIANALRDKLPRYVDLTPAGRIISWRIAPATGFEAR